MYQFNFPRPPLVLFNTYERIKQKFEPKTDNHVLMYTCGPTVYHYAHIGNFRTYVFEDILRRTLKFFGYQVTQAMNITDIDDKTIKGAIANKCTLLQYTDPYTRAFFIDLAELGIEPVEYYPRATEYVPQMIDFIQKLIDNGSAYSSSDGSVYFSIDKFKNYGRLSRLKREGLQVGAGDRRLAADEYDKEQVADFVLWKGYEAERDGAVFWESPFGRGRPGWHLECSTMAMELLGKTLDLHVGGVDNIFPHHENEIAQSESCCDQQFVRHWMHSEHLLVDGKKMSKSLGNFFTLRDLLKRGYQGKQVRYMLMQTHYRIQLNFTEEGCRACQNSLKRINDFIQRMSEHKQGGEQPTEFMHQLLQAALNRFTESLADDLNLSEALASLFDLMHGVNTYQDSGKLSVGDAKEVLFVLKQFDRVLNVMELETTLEVPQELLEMLEKRNIARSQRDWKASDALRDAILARGYQIEDTPSGARLKKNN